ncbi:DNRLRE domain-containing protein [Nonomuraea sp. SMC257]|uniref:DNRLRE domain-containing protein n=1 Tax=Nonomuraea montanisoli TaxID=2741721 RepID=A0A7Y6M8B4_9ACTN|nr:endo-1,3-alpha-glucanase family glycosylhydrolase [Nonomuraea montanisoli]NUW37204.1 DNRLRE domain-containing protein [Nonomuraea montanisoli]
MPNRLRAWLAAVVVVAGAGAGTAPQAYAEVGAETAAQGVTSARGAQAAPKSVTVDVSQDTYLSQASPAQEHAAHTWLSACPSTCDGKVGSERQALVKFTVAGLPANASDVQMTLKLQAARTTDSSVAARKVSGAWTDAATWANRPALGTTLATAKGLTSGEDVALDVSAAFTGNGAYAFAITGTAGAQAVFHSAEATAGDGPRLTVTYTEGAPGDDDESGATTDGPLPFTLASTSKLRASGKKVFAHYFPPYPISLDNQAPASDYYARNYLKPEGESGKHSAYGGLLRDRPIGRSPLSGEYVLEDLKTEVRQAIAAGLDGFTVDILSVSSNNWTRVQNLVKAAAAVDPGFKIVLMPDMNGLSSVDSATLATALAKLASSPAVYKLGDGRLVVAPFKAENRTAAWWSTWMKTMKDAHGVKVALVPTFLDFNKNRDAFASISYGFSNWGNRNPAANASLAPNISRAHTMGKIWMQPVSVQDSRPNQGIYDEAGNTENLRLTWKGAIDGGADWVQLTTWNDYSEGTQFAPSANNGWTFLDISSYYLTCFKLGCPKVTNDVLYLTHRVQTAAAQPTYAETKLMRLRGGSTPARDMVEVLTMLTASTPVTVTVGGQKQTYTAPAGVSAKTFPLTAGAVSVSATRGNALVAKSLSAAEVKARPYVQTLQYYGVSSGR